MYFQKRQKIADIPENNGLLLPVDAGDIVIRRHQQKYGYADIYESDNDRSKTLKPESYHMKNRG
jgi:hypothetical protein